MCTCVCTNIPCMFLDKPIVLGVGGIWILYGVVDDPWQEYGGRPKIRSTNRPLRPMVLQWRASLHKLTIAAVKISTIAVCRSGATPFNNTSLSQNFSTSLHNISFLFLSHHINSSFPLSSPSSHPFFLLERDACMRIQLLVWDKKETSGSRRGAERRKWFNVAARLSRDLLLLSQGWNIFFLRPYMFSFIL